MGKNYRNCSKTFRRPKRAFEKERMDSEMKLLGEYGLKNKREVWRVAFTLAKIRKAARLLLTLPENDPKRLFEGGALLRRMVRFGLLAEDENKLDYVLGLTIQKLMERRLQTQVFRSSRVSSMHAARTMIRGRHFCVGQQLVNVPSFMVRVDRQGFIDFSEKSAFSLSGRPGRVARKNQNRGGGAADEE